MAFDKHLSTKADYAEYERRVAEWCEGKEAFSTGPCPGCEDCGIDKDAEDYHEDPWFSWSPCTVCDRDLGGDRVSLHYIIPGPRGGIRGKPIEHDSCCTDCMYYLEYGKLDDETMWRIEHSVERTPEQESEVDE